MDLGEKEEFGMEKMSADHQSYTSMSTEWRLGDPRMGLIAPGASVCQGGQMCSSECTPAASMADTFGGRRHWGVHPANSQSLAFCDGAIQSGASPAVVVSPRNPIAPPPRRLDMGWNVQESGMPRDAMFLQSGVGVIPPSLPSQFPTDSAFVERAARFSCFGGVGFGGAVSPFGSGDHMSPYGNSAQKGSAGAQASQNASISSDAPFNRGNGVGIAGNDSGDPEFSGGGREETPSSDNTAGGEPSSKGVVAKKRKGGNQEMDQDQSKGDSQLPVETKENAPGNQKGGRKTSTSPSAKPGGRNGKDNASDASKEDYIHVRARRGQATNSHSLAERLRREKISERMKFLQDLVPGCSKVTGKAVMLDEIINYVQSLQRQVEFLSMKLAAVNPPLDVNIEGLLSKEILQSRANALPFGLTPEIGHHQMHPSQRAFVQSAIPGMRNPSDSHRRPLNIHLAALNGGYKEPSNQISTPWDDELHNVVHVDFGSSAALSIQDMQGSCSSSLMKMEP